MALNFGTTNNIQPYISSLCTLLAIIHAIVNGVP